MSLPGDVLSATPVAAPLLAPDNAVRLKLTEDFERGGVALNDPSQGLDVRDWRVFTDGTGVWVVPVPALGAEPVLLLTGSGITEVALAFDQNMQPTVAYVEAGLLKLWWYDSLLGAMTTTSYPGATGPMLTLDDKRRTQLGGSDILFAYVREGFAYWRQQRDRYGVEYLMGETLGAVRITQLGMGENGRVQFKMLSVPRGGFTDLLTDKLFVINGQELSPVNDGDVQEAVWRSKTFVADEQPALPWARIDGDYPAQLRLYGDGELVYATPPITSAQPFRLPAQRWREWAVEVVASSRVVEVSMAHSREEL